MKRLAVVLFFVAVFTSGCAFIPHKPVVIKPDLSVKENTIGQGQEVWINVVDERSELILGTRSFGIGSEISVEGDLRMAVSNSLTDGLMRQSFSPVYTRSSDGRELRVEIRNLNYTLTQGFWENTVRARCGLKAFCFLGNSRLYEYLYRGEYQTGVSNGI